MLLELIRGFTETFNPITLISAVLTGFMFGFLAFVPLIRRIVPEGAPPASARTALWGTFFICMLLFGSVVTVFYVQQVSVEVVVDAIIRGTRNPAVYGRAVGRYAAFAVFLTSFSYGVALLVWREFHRREKDQ